MPDRVDPSVRAKLPLFYPSCVWHLSSPTTTPWHLLILPQYLPSKNTCFWKYSNSANFDITFGTAAIVCPLVDHYGMHSSLGKPNFQKVSLILIKIWSEFQFSKLWYHIFSSSYCVWQKIPCWSVWHALQPQNTQLPKSVISFDQNDLNRERDNNVRWTRPQKRCHQFRWFRTRSRKRCHQFRLEKTSLKQAKHRACLD